MQKWSKFQFQSRILNVRLFFILFTVVVISIQPLAFGTIELKDNQKNLEIGQVVQTDRLVLEIQRDEGVHVKHIIEFGSWGGVGQQKHIEILPGGHSNLKVADEDGDPLGYGVNGDSFEESEYVVLIQKLGVTDLIVEYDLDNFFVLENGLWSKQIKFPHDVEVRSVDDIRFIVVNSRAVDISDSAGINCIGCQMTLEFFDNEKFDSYEFVVDEIVHKLNIITNDAIHNLQFVDETKLIEFEVTNPDQIVIAEIPFTMILNPYRVFLTDGDDLTLDQTDQIKKSEFGMEKNSVFVSFRTDTSGIISIVGATQEEHNIKQEKLLELEEDMIEKTSQEKSSMISDNTDSSDNTEIFKEWQKSLPDKPENNSDNTQILIIIAVIVAIAIVTIIVKIKRN